MLPCSKQSAHCACILIILENAAQRVFSPSPAPNASPTNVPALLPSDVANYLFPVLEPSLAPIASPTTAPTTVPTRASDAIVTTTTPPAPEPTRAPDSFTLFTPTASPVEVPALEEETTNGGVGTTKTQGGLGPGAGTALGAGLLVLIGGVFILRRKGKKDDEADATTAQPTDLEGGSSA
jgi:hypothetical protein